MLFVKKGYCIYSGKKCRLLKVENGNGYCKKIRAGYGDHMAVLMNEKTGERKRISTDKNCNIEALEWCPKLKHKH